MARWIVLILGFVCLVPSLGFGLLWLVAKLWNLVERNKPGSALVDVGLKAQYGWTPIVVVTGLGIALVIIGLNMPSAKSRD